MIRLFLRLLRITDFEVCKSCETLKQQLAFEQDRTRQLTESLMNIIQPKAVESIPVEINPIMNTSALFSRRRAAAEARDRQEAVIKKSSELIGRPDDLTSRLEEELDIKQEG